MDTLMGSNLVCLTKILNTMPDNIPSYCLFVSSLKTHKFLK